MIRFENIKMTYHKKTVINDLSFEIKKGEFVVLIGPSGCGKTTLLKMINRLNKPTAGEIYIDGKSISSTDEVELRRNIGYIIQQTGLFPHMTIRENIEVVPRLQKRNKQAIAAKSIELMAMVGLDPDEYLDRYPTQLSGGQQQRVGVARAFACDPDVILMDEPFSALDPITRSLLQDELIELQEKVQKTIVFVTHDMDEAIKIADKICILNGGEIVQFDEPEEIMKNPVNEFVAEFVGKNRIWSAPEFIRAKDIMIEKPICASPDMTVTRGIEKMRSNKVDRLLITNKQHQLLGIISAKAIQSQIDKKIPLSQIMWKEFEKVGPEDSIIEILQIVDDLNLSAIPVCDEANNLLGLLTKGSLLTTLSQQYLLDTPTEVV